MGRCLLAIKALLANAAIKALSGYVNGHRIPVSDSITANSRCAVVHKQLSHTAPKCWPAYSDFLKISNVSSMSSWDPEHPDSRLTRILSPWLHSLKKLGTAVIRDISDSDQEEFLIMAHGLEIFSWDHKSPPVEKEVSRAGREKEVQSEHCCGCYQSHICMTWSTTGKKTWRHYDERQWVVYFLERLSFKYVTLSIKMGSTTDQKWDNLSMLLRNPRSTH